MKRVQQKWWMKDRIELHAREGRGVTARCEHQPTIIIQMRLGVEDRKARLPVATIKAVALSESWHPTPKHTS